MPALLDLLADSLWRLRSVLPKGFARVLFKRFVRQLAAPDFPFTTDFYGLRYEGNLNNNVDFRIYFYGAFEKPLLYFLSDTLKALAPAGGRFVDVGANIGQHSLYMSRYARSVISFEPYEVVRKRLLGQIARNGIDNIEVRTQGLSDDNGWLDFYAPSGRNEGIGSFDASTTEKGNRPVGRLELIRGDDFFLPRADEPIDLMKIDVEGFEKPALQGLRQTLLRDRPVLVCEITYGKPLSFASRDEILHSLPPEYELLTFDKRRSDGSKARRQASGDRASGRYRLVPYAGPLAAGQDDVIACPREKLDRLPRTNQNRTG